ncbi:MAG: gamma-glutamylcyclotransferase [Alphaproteobacteria bacterium]
MRDFWIFAYGSLMWAADFPVAVRLPVRLSGWHRRFSLSSPRSWGTPECPGLCAALHEGGECGGLALRVEAAHASGVRAQLARREAAYRFRELRVDTEDGDSLTALTFVWDPGEPRFLPDLTLSQAAAIMRKAECGRMGRSVEYLVHTIETLEAAGFDAAPERGLLAELARAPETGI